MDPLSEDYHDWSVYAFSGNRVVDSRELEGLEPKKVTEVSLPDDPTEFAEMIGGGINSLRSSVSNLSARAYNVLISDRVRNKYEVDQNGYLNLVTGVPRETRREKIVNTIGDLATIGLAAVGGPEGMLTAQGGKASILRTVEEAKTLAKTGRSGKQARLRELGSDMKVSRFNRGWIKNEIRHIKTGNRKTIRNPRNSPKLEDKRYGIGSSTRKKS
ncbi:hypothetical protein QE441_000845 [Chryseobacterium sp. SORGH_AS909]|uniref:hypothetical protein n=1 Tax=Chryseobacterium sp. SORGH_AS_0909 TaxID=3041759 RepID=UPI00286770D2|nr:hypothetical protein [Chryseobacterium sp. SORGH_AS_0909]MDR6085051.1 hypothetical protein [Chryseobacterium sp. SORGH_AS_0909]